MQTVSEKRARVQAEVAMQKLPGRIHPVPNPSQQGARCEACGTEEDSDENVMLQCDGPCKLFIHQACCGLLGKSPPCWMCEVCRTGQSFSCSYMRVHCFGDQTGHNNNMQKT